MLKEDQTKDVGFPADLLYGVLSVVRQFGGVLGERGQEYRNSVEGRMLGLKLESLYRDLGEREKKVVDVVLTSLDELTRVVRELDRSLKDANGYGANGHGGEAQDHAAREADSAKDGAARPSREETTTD